MASNLLGPGDPAPAFALPAVNREGQVSLDDYRGRSPVLIALFRGLHCPFCRRQLVQLGTTQDKLKALGVETMAVVNTPLER
ncbi:MAG TPA: redoxin domain-containing protein, partial [Methylomirabilota bacterium]|nr:redoxin domain-containing protein [Methylomirabilota bacterium]